MREEILIIIIIQKNILNRNRVKDEFNNQNSFKNFNEFKKWKFYNNLNSDFKFLRKDGDVTTRAFDNNIKRNINTYNDRNNDVCVYYKKKDYWKFNYFDRDKS